MKAKWRKFEDKLKKDFQGKRTKASGNLWYMPGDVISGDKRFLIEAKQTDKKSYSISLKTWDKLYEEALFSKLIPLLCIKIQDAELVIISKADFLKYTDSSQG